MKFSKLAELNLIQNGMFEEHAKEVVEFAKTSSVMGAMATNWEQSISAYPTSLQKVFLKSLHIVCLEWIGKNQPEAWYRPMFMTEAEQASYFEAKN